MTSSTLNKLGFAALLVLASGFVGSADAQNAEDMAAMKANCRMDYMRLCAGMSPGGPEVRECFHRNRANLSQACGTAIDAYTSMSRSGSPAAEPDPTRTRHRTDRP